MVMSATVSHITSGREHILGNINNNVHESVTGIVCYQNIFIILFQWQAYESRQWKYYIQNDNDNNNINNIIMIDQVYLCGDTNWTWTPVLLNQWVRSGIKVFSPVNIQSLSSVCFTSPGQPLLFLSPSFSLYPSTPFFLDCALSLSLYPISTTIPFLSLTFCLLTSPTF